MFECETTGISAGSSGSRTGESSIGFAHSDTMVEPAGPVIGGFTVFIIVTDHGLVVTVAEVVTATGRPLSWIFSSSYGASSGFSPILINSLLFGASTGIKMAEAIGSETVEELVYTSETG